MGFRLPCDVGRDSLRLSGRRAEILSGAPRREVGQIDSVGAERARGTSGPSVLLGTLGRR
jgi:hypothetical protein